MRLGCAYARTDRGLDLQLVLVVLVDIDQGITRQPDQLGIVVKVSPGQCAEEKSVLGRAMEVVALTHWSRAASLIVKPFLMTGRTASFADPICKLSAAQMGARPHCRNQHGVVPVVLGPWERAVCPGDEQGVPRPNGGQPLLGLRSTQSSRTPPEKLLGWCDCRYPVDPGPAVCRRTKTLSQWRDNRHTPRLPLCLYGPCKCIPAG